MDIDLFKKELLKPLRSIRTKLKTVIKKIDEGKFEESDLLLQAIEKEFEKEFMMKCSHLMKAHIVIKIIGIIA